MTAFDSPTAHAGDLSSLAQSMYFQSDDAHQMEHAAAAKKAARAERPLRWTAIVNTLGTIGLWAMVRSKHLDADPAMERLIAIHAAMSAAYWGLWIWSFAAPLPAAIVGLLLLTSMSWANIAIQTDNTGTHYRPGAGPSVPLITMVLLCRAIYSGWKQRVLVLDRQLLPDQPRPRSRSILSAIMLYLVLLSICITPLSLAAHQDLTMKDLLDVHKLMGIVIAVWAIICWRDTLPAIRQIGSINWLVTGVVFGLGTFIFASIYGDLLSFFTGMPSPKMSAPFLKEGWSWIMILGLTALFPAIFEELAFRGVILPRLGRVLSEKETIAVSGMMFMILHLSVPSAPHLLLMGIAVGFVRMRSKSLWPCVLMHFTHNAMCIAFERWI